MASYPVVDLHCDFLAYLAMNPDRTPFDPIVRCSSLQRKEGNVALQVLAISAETIPYSLVLGLKQYEIYLSLFEKYPEHFSDNVIPAFENASAFCMENEPLDAIFKRLDKMLKKIQPLYIGLTWNGQNRFAGGCGSNIGLKDEGKQLLAYLSGRGIAIDFAHTTDETARDILNEIDKKNLNLRVMASHSNFRKVCENRRNLPDDIAKEIIARRGIIGLVFYSKFLEKPTQLAAMIEHGLSLGGESALAFGADFFCDADFPHLSPNKPGKPGFFEEMSDSSTYPWILDMLEKELSLTHSQLEAIASNNSHQFINSCVNKSNAHL